MWPTATGKRPDCGSVQFSPMYISSPVDWTFKCCPPLYSSLLLKVWSIGLKKNRTELNKTTAWFIFQLWLPKFGLFWLLVASFQIFFYNHAKTSCNQWQLVKLACILHTLVITFITLNQVFGSSRMVKN